MDRLNRSGFDGLELFKEASRTTGVSHPSLFRQFLNQKLPQMRSSELNNLQGVAQQRGALNVFGGPTGGGDVNASSGQSQDSLFQELLRRYGG